MANVTKKNVRQQRSHAAPYGNKWVEKYHFETNASGVFLDSDKATAVVQADVVRIGIIPAGVELHDGLAIVSDLFNATSTAKIGFAYVDGVDSTTVPQDDDYFFAALALSAAGRTRANNTAVAPVILPKDAYLNLVLAAADLSAAGVLDMIVEGRMVGVVG